MIGISTLMSLEGHCPGTVNHMDLAEVTTAHASVIAMDLSNFLL